MMVADDLFFFTTVMAVPCVSVSNWIVKFAALLILMFMIIAGDSPPFLHRSQPVLRLSSVLPLQSLCEIYFCQAGFWPQARSSAVGLTSLNSLIEAAAELLILCSCCQAGYCPQARFDYCSKHNYCSKYKRSKTLVDSQSQSRRKALDCIVLFTAIIAILKNRSIGVDESLHWTGRLAMIVLMTDMLAFLLACMSMTWWRVMSTCMYQYPHE